eukprot:3872045-Pyramimonas_sp.AAC.1
MPPSAATNLPLLLLLDFGNAFPSLIHMFLWRVLELAGPPAGFRLALHATYAFATARVALQGLLLPFCLDSGVMQGGPSSGSLWALAMDPLSRDMRSRLRKHPGSEVGVCADDVEVAVRELAALSRLSGTFYAARLLAGLWLKIPKCQIIHVSAPLSSQLAEQVQSRLSQLVPRWAAMPIVSAAEYIGVWIGPAASRELMWRRAFLEWVVIVKELAATKAAPSIAVTLYNSRAVSKPSYLSQLSRMPQPALRWESWALHKTLRLPAFSFPLSQLLALRQWSKIRPQSMLVQSLAALLRTSKQTITNWRSLWKAHQQAAREVLPMGMWIQGKWEPVRWIEPSY